MSLSSSWKINPNRSTLMDLPSGLNWSIYKTNPETLNKKAHNHPQQVLDPSWKQSNWI